MSQLNLIVTSEFEANLRRIMAGRGFTTKSEALRTVVAEEARRQEERKVRRLEAIERFQGSIPNDSENPTDWKKEKDWVHEGMDS